jgi:hypothetical protein
VSDIRKDLAAVFEDTGGGVEQVLAQICSEVLLAPVPVRQPAIIRAGAAVGLELLDLLLNPDHVVRTTEELSLRNATTLDRRYRVDIALDRLSRQKEDGAAQLSALLSERLDPEELLRTGEGRRLWIPLMAVPRPVAGSMEVYDTDGIKLPRPAQQEVRSALQAALYHVFRETMRLHPTFKQATSPLNTLMRQDNSARWLLQHALVSVCEDGPYNWRSKERLNQFRAEGGSVTNVFRSLAELARQQSDSHRKTALLVLGEVLSFETALLELVDLVHCNYFVIAALDSGIRDHSVTFSLPATQSRGSEHQFLSIFKRNRRALDFREHNYSMRVVIPVPPNTREYRVHLVAPHETGERTPSAMCLLAATLFEAHPGQDAVEALGACEAELNALLSELRTANASSVATERTQSDRHQLVRFVASRAVSALIDLRTVVIAQKREVMDLRNRWMNVESKTVGDIFTQALDRTGDARTELDQSIGLLQNITRRASHTPLEDQLETVLERLRQVTKGVQQPLLHLQLAGDEMARSEVGRARINRRRGTAALANRPVRLTLWACVSDETRPYAVTTMLPPIGLSVFVYALGALLFGGFGWVYRFAFERTDDVYTAEPDALVALLLLVPAFALTRLQPPDLRSVSGRLRRSTRFFVAGSFVTLAAAATVVATKLGRQVGSREAEVVAWTFRLTLLFLLCWLLWSIVAWRVRDKFIWQPKGVRALLDLDPPGPPGAWHATRRFVARYCRYEHKAPDAEFDLTVPSGIILPADRNGL